MIPNGVLAWLEENGHGALVAQHSVAGGCINNGTRIETSAGGAFFLKSNDNAPEDMFAREAEGLEALRSGQGPRFPQVYLVGSDFLLLEDLAPATRTADYWATLGRQLAQLHQRRKAEFGFDHDNYIGSTPQPNSWMEDGFDFFAEQRLGFQARQARDKGLLTRQEAAQVDNLAARLPELIPAQAASLSHGDLWGGNAISDTKGEPALIDPAAHYGWPEAELAMTSLFGGFDAEFYASYEESSSLERDWRARFPIYNLYHLLNHLNLFGRSYHGQVMSILRRFG